MHYKNVTIAELTQARQANQRTPVWLCFRRVQRGRIVLHTLEGRLLDVAHS